jgi:hypothetical protein
VDGRNYDWAGLAASADLLFVMSYDMQSQVSDGCENKGCKADGGALVNDQVVMTL